MMQQILNNLISNPKRLFLIDSLGAVLTAWLLGGVLTSFEAMFGMPRKILYVLAFIACVFAVYSFLCHVYIATNWKPYLKAIAIANLLYCCLSIALVIYFYEALSYLGILYFLGEIVVVMGLVRIELKAVAQ